MADHLNVGDKAYTRLPGRAKPLFGFFVNEKQRLYLGDDHLFVATTSHYYERYKRFFLADIQSLSIQKTARGAILNMVLGTCAGLLAALAIAGYLNQWDPAAQIILVIIAGLFTGGALLNTAFGPTCSCQILTAVHEEPLHCLGRLYTAQRVVEYLRSVVEGVQGSAGDIAEKGQRVERAIERHDMALVLRKDSGRLHMALFAVLIVDALIGTVVIFYRDLLPPWLTLLSNAVILSLVLAAAIRQRESDIPKTVRTTVWVALAFNVALFAVGMYISVFVEALQQTPDASAALAVRSAYLTVGNVVNLIVNSALGAFGIYNLRIWRRAVAVQAEQQRISEDETAQQ